jgi:hypothetical protein
VIARDDNVHARQGVEERARIAELRAARALGQVARHRDHIGVEIGDARDERRNDVGDGGPEVQIGQVRDGSHQGVNTRKAFSRN